MARSPQRRRHNGQSHDYRDRRGDPPRPLSGDHRYEDSRDRDRDRERDRDSYDSRRTRDRAQYDARSDRDRDRDRDFQPKRRDDRAYIGRYDDPPPSRRNRSRDRRRSRERIASPVREKRRRSRDSHRRDREVYDDRDRKRPRRGSSASRGETSRPSTADHEAAAAEESSKAQKLAKVEAWKKARLQSQAVTTTANTVASDSPATNIASPIAESPDALHPVTADGSPAPAPDIISPAEAPRAKFDPKAIRKRAAEKLQQGKKGALGDDAALPAHVSSATNNVNVTPSRPAFSAHDKAGPALKATNGKISGFGLSTSSLDKPIDKAAVGTASTALDEDDTVKRQIKKLPDLPTANDDDGMNAGDEDDQDGDFADDLRSDEEEAEAAREALRKRAEEAESKADGVEMKDVDTVGSIAHQATTSAPTASNPDAKVEDEDEIDPLDAYMKDLFASTAVSDRPSRDSKIFDGYDGKYGGMDAVGDDPILKDSKRKKKDLPRVDHSKVQYDEFRKNFYTESPELAEMTEDEVEELRAELDNITLTGASCPKPITKWSQGAFGAQILDLLQKQNFAAPTAIQSQALPALMSGRDTIGIAKTGSGKTLAFLLPMFRHVADQRRVANMEGPIGLIMAPTRELSVQIHRECKPYLNALGLRGVCAYGGAPIKDQIAELKRGAEVLVCTPGRFIDLLWANSGRVTNLRRVTYVVLDEADRMFDMGFEPQIRGILGNIQPNRQTVLFSATFPAKMESLARSVTSTPIQITVGGRSIVAPEITQIIEIRSEESKFLRVLELLGQYLYADDGTRVLIFVERQETADILLRDLARHKYPSLSVHGGRDQIDRDQAISDFKAGHVPIMIATSVAARGLDVKQLNLVINFDSPNHGEDYVHRSGRTGRAGNTGTAITFVTPEQEQYAPFLVKALKESQKEVPEALQTMAASYKQKVKSGEAKRAGNGFGGKGIDKLDAARQIAQDANRLRLRKHFGIGEDADMEDDSESKANGDSKKNSIEEQIAKAAGSVKDRDAQTDQPAYSAIPEALANKLTSAMKVTRTERPAEANNTNDTLSKVKAMAAQISDRLGSRGGTRTGASTDNRGPDAGAFSAILEINDFPQKARWAVTNRTNVAKILDSTGTSITSKGNFYPAGATPGPTDPPKLYILVEGDTEIAVSAAMRELTNHLREGTEQAQEIEARSGVKGRYNVL